MSINFEFYELEYQSGWITAEQLQQVVSLGILTPAEYEQIVGQPYPAPTQS